MTLNQATLTRDNAEVLALRALAYVIGNEALATRLLALTGLDGETLRQRAGSREVLAATLDFLAGHEADLIACAEAIDIPPQSLAAARAALA